MALDLLSPLGLTHLGPQPQDQGGWGALMAEDHPLWSDPAPAAWHRVLSSSYRDRLGGAPGSQERVFS